MNNVTIIKSSGEINSRTLSIHNEIIFLHERQPETLYNNSINSFPNLLYFIFYFDLRLCQC